MLLLRSYYRCVILRAWLPIASGTKGRKGRVKGTKSAALVTTDEEESEVEKLTDDVGIAPPRPKPRPRTRRQGPAPVEPEVQGESQQEDGERDVEPETSTPRPRSRPKATYKTKSPNKSPTKPSTRSPERPFTLPDIEVNTSTPMTSRKRARSEELEREDGYPSMVESPEGSRPVSREATPSDEIQIRRKRVRH